MKVSNHHNLLVGFSLIEALVALLILSILLGSLFTFQSQLIRGVFRTHGVVERIPVIKNALTKIEQQQLYTKQETQKITDKETNTKITYQLKTIAQTSSLHAIKNLRQEIITAEWPSVLTTQDIEFVGFRFYPVLQKAEGIA